MGVLKGMVADGGGGAAEGLGFSAKGGLVVAYLEMSWARGGREG